MFREAGHFQKERDGTYSMRINKYYNFTMTKEEIKECYSGAKLLHLTQVCHYKTLAGTETTLEEKDSNYIMYLGKTGKAFIIEFLRENKKFSLPRGQTYMIMNNKEDKCELSEIISLATESPPDITIEDIDKLVIGLN